MKVEKTSREEKEKREDVAVNLVRNALLVAGQEMGNGDEWPVIKDTVYKIMKDREDVRIERNVDEEMQEHLYAQLQVMEAGLEECDDEMRAKLEPKIKELREVCDAYFSEVDENLVVRDEEDEPLHIKRMKAILATMEGSHEK